MFAAAVERSAATAIPTQATSDIGRVASGVALNLLKLAKEASAPLPPLQAALGAAVTAWEICKVCASLFVACIESDYVLYSLFNRNIAQIKITFRHLLSTLTLWCR